jgi:hypothetical protein
VEIDARQTLDGQVVVHHDPWIETSDGDVLALIENDLSELRAASRFPLHLIEEFVDVFSEIATKSGIYLHIDIKSRVATRKIFEIVSVRLRPNQYSIVSWIPEVLEQYHSFDPNVRLCLSNISTDWSIGYRVAEALLSDTTMCLVSKLVSPFSKKLALELSSLDFRFAAKAGTSQGEGNTVCVFNPMPSADIVELLRSTKGYVCLPNRFTTRMVVEAYKARGVDVALFSFDKADKVNRHPLVNVIDYFYFDGAICFPQGLTPVDC